jgi:hypothetical protein
VQYSTEVFAPGSIDLHVMRSLQVSPDEDDRAGG